VKQRSADPYRDLDVIDARAPRFNQTVIGALALVAFLTGWWPLLAVLAAQLALGLTLGRRWCLPCLAYFELVQPLAGEGPIEDARPPRFANLIGAGVLGAASLAHAAGLSALGWSLGLLVAGLALLAAATGFCAGCEIYRLGARLRGVRSHRLERLDLAELGLSPDGELVVEFTHPLCTDCRTLEARLRREGRRVVTVDVSARPELARKYGVAVVPTAVIVTGDGAVVNRLAG
jgi:thiol-disulfide isomerase/thioredoxin